jgi:general stress protein 26
MEEDEMDENEAKRLTLNLMETSWEVYVSTIGENGSPDTRAMDNLRSKERYPKLTKLFESSKDEFWVLLSTNTSSAKMRHLRINPAGCVYYCEPRRSHGVMLDGRINIVGGNELNEMRRALWHDYWTQYYHQGVDDPDFSVLSLHPVHAKGWNGSDRFEFTLKHSQQQVHK